MSWRLFAACASLLAVSSVYALDPIDTDGPDFVESSEVVPKGHFQYEIDVTSTKARFSPAEMPTISTPALLKYGFADNFELRIAPEGYLRQNGMSGVGDTALGLKWHALDRNAETAAPSVSWLLHFDLPTGSRDFRGSGVRPSLRSVLTWDLPGDYALGVMPGARYDTRGDGHRFASAIFGAVLNKKFSDKVRVFIEASAPQIAHAEDGGVLASWDVGTAYLVSNDVQIGARAGIAANRNSPGSYMLFEIAQRF